jgi:plastocyanin
LGRPFATFVSFCFLFSLIRGYPCDPWFLEFLFFRVTNHEILPSTPVNGQNDLSSWEVKKGNQKKLNQTKEQKMKSLKFLKRTLATTLGIDSGRLVLLLATAVSLLGYPKPASAATFDVVISSYGPWVFFSPSPVTIHPGDQVKWTWGRSGHSTTSGRPGMPNGIWNSGVRSQGATFTHTFNSVGTFPYYCTAHVGEATEVGGVIVAT